MYLLSCDILQETAQRIALCVCRCAPSSPNGGAESSARIFTTASGSPGGQEACSDFRVPDAPTGSRVKSARRQTGKFLSVTGLPWMRNGVSRQVTRCRPKGKPDSESGPYNCCSPRRSMRSAAVLAIGPRPPLMSQAPSCRPPRRGAPPAKRCGRSRRSCFAISRACRKRPRSRPQAGLSPRRPCRNHRRD